MKIQRWTTPIKKTLILSMRKTAEQGEDIMDMTIQRTCSPAESLENSLIEMKLMREGKIQKRSLDDFLQKLKREIHKEQE